MAIKCGKPKFLEIDNHPRSTWISNGLQNNIFMQTRIPTDRQNTGLRWPLETTLVRVNFPSDQNQWVVDQFVEVKMMLALKWPV